ncbi:hypothetical protein CsSME_00018236 [Camellia sinensis var. sinensis]
MKISFFLCSEELLASLRETLKSVKDIPHILKKFNSPSSACTTGDWTAFLKVKFPLSWYLFRVQLLQ